MTFGGDFLAGATAGIVWDANTPSTVASHNATVTITKLLIDVAFTFVFVLAILGIVRKVENKFFAAIEIGLILTALVLTGATLNPAINFGTAIFSAFADTAALKDVWLFIVGPLVGGALAALTAWILFKGEDEAPKKETPKIAAPTTAKKK